MTHSENLSMQPGPELDRLVAERLFDAKVRSYRKYEGGTLLYKLILNHKTISDAWVHESGAWSAIPRYSQSWEGMRLVVEAMAAKGWELELRYNGKRAIADFHNAGRCRRVKYATAPHAVAIAARLALEGDHAR